MTDFLAEGHRALQAAIKKTEHVTSSPDYVKALADVARAYGELALIEKGLIPPRLTEKETNW